MQVAHADDVGELIRLDAAGEDEAAEVVVVLLQDVIAIALGIGDTLHVAAVANTIGADAQKNHILPSIANPLGDFHEDVEAAHRLEPARDVGDNPRPRRDLSVANPPRNVAAIPNVRVDAVEHRVDFRLVLDREQALLPLRRRVPGRARLQVEQDHRVSSARAQQVQLFDRNLRAEVEVRVAAVIVVLEVIDDRAVVKVGQKRRRTEPTVSDNEVRLHFGMRLHHFVDTVRVPHTVLERPAAIVDRLGRSAGQLVLKPLNAIEHSGRQLAYERASKAMLLDEIAGDVSELRRKILVDEEDVHQITPWIFLILLRALCVSVVK